MDQLAGEMKWCSSILAVTETHLTSEEEMVLDAETSYRLLFSGRSDGSNVDGVGIALSAYARVALRCYRTVPLWELSAEFLT